MYNEVHNFKRWQHTDMKEEMRTEAIEVIVSSVEKYAGKYDLAVSLRLSLPSHVV